MENTEALQSGPVFMVDYDSSLALVIVENKKSNRLTKEFE